MENIMAQIGGVGYPGVSEAPLLEDVSPETIMDSIITRIDELQAQDRTYIAFTEDIVAFLRETTGLSEDEILMMISQWKMRNPNWRTKIKE